MHTFTQTRSPLAPNANAYPLDVVKIKSALSALGHYEAPEWGISQFPDGDLFRAIQAFQKAQGLKTDGVIKPDGETLAALQGTLKGAKGRTATQTTALVLQDMGRNGDTLLAHLTPAEAQLLHDITDGGSINPETGLLEFWGRLGGSKASRARREKAENRAASAERSASGNQQSGDWSNERNRTLGYNDFNPGGMHGDKNRNGTKKTGAALGAHNRAVAAQQAAAEKAAEAQRVQAQLHADAQRAKEQKTAEAQRQHEQDLSREAARAQNYGAMTANEKENTLSRMFSTKPTKARATGFSLSDTAAATPPTTNAPAQSTQAAPAPSTPNLAASADPRATPSATPAQQFRNIKKAEKMKAKAAKDAAKAKQAAEKQLTTTATLSFSSAPQVHTMTAPQTRTYTPKQLAAAAQANKTAAIGRQRVKDYLSTMSKPENQPANRPSGMTAAGTRKAAWDVAKAGSPSTRRTQDQKSADVGEQPLSGTVGLQGRNIPADVAKVQGDLVAQGVMEPKHATGHPGAAMVDAIKALQQKYGLPVNGTIIPGGQAEVVLTQDQKAANVGEQPLMGTGSLTDSWDGNRTPDEKAADVGEQPMPSEKEINHWSNYKRSSSLSKLTGKLNDGLIAAGKGNISGIDWNEKPDDQFALNAGSFFRTTTFHVDGPIRIEPQSTTIGYESAKIRINWFQLDENGKVIPEYRRETEHPDEYNVGGGVNGGPGYLDFAPPYPEHNQNGYIAMIVSPPQGSTNGNGRGIYMNIFTQDGDKPATKAE